MRTLSQPLLDALADPTAVIPTYTKITRRDGVVLRLVDLDVDSSYAGETYSSSGGQERSAVQFTSGLSADNVDVNGVYDSELIDEGQLLAGAFNYAAVEVFLAVHNSPTLEKIVLLQGYFGEFSYDMGRYKMSVNVYNYGFSHSIGAVTSPTSRSLLGSPREPVNLAAYQINTTIIAVDSPNVLRVAATVNSAYNDGVAFFTTGAASGLEAEILDAAGNVVTLFLPMTVVAAVGDGVRLTQGYDGSRAQCSSKFNNLLNFNGEPDLPGQDEFMNPTVRRV